MNNSVLTSNDIYIIKNSIPEMLCEDIIDLFEEDIAKDNRVLNIPKKNEKWDKIERIIYKEILIKLNEYKLFLIKNAKDDDGMEFINQLNNDLFVRDFKIEKCSSDKSFSRLNNRYNVITFIFYLNTPNNIDTAGLINKRGNLIIFKDIDYHFIKTINDQYIITGQLCSNNVV